MSPYVHLFWSLSCLCGRFNSWWTHLTSLLCKEFRQEMLKITETSEGIECARMVTSPRRKVWQNILGLGKILYGLIVTPNNFFQGCKIDDVYIVHIFNDIFYYYFWQLTFVISRGIDGWNVQVDSQHIFSWLFVTKSMLYLRHMDLVNSPRDGIFTPCTGRLSLVGILTLNILKTVHPTVLKYKTKSS